MLKSITLLCPDCGGTFRTYLDTATEPMPRYCALCGFDTQGGQALAEGVASPHLQRPIKNVVDHQYRDMEAGAEFRAEMAKEKFGLDTESANALKMTDMKDGLREGDTSNIPVNNEVSRQIDAAPQHFGFQGGAAQGMGYSASVPTGLFPNAGGRTAARLRAGHAKMMGNAGHAGAVTSSAPALETDQPNYRRRVRDW